MRLRGRVKRVPSSTPPMLTPTLHIFWAVHRHDGHFCCTKIHIVVHTGGFRFENLRAFVTSL